MPDPASSGRRRVGLAQFHRDMERASAPLREMERVMWRATAPLRMAEEANKRMSRIVAALAPGKLAAELLGEVEAAPPPRRKTAIVATEAPRPDPARPPKPPTRKKQVRRRGRKRREISAGCEPCLWQLADQRPDVSAMTAREIEKTMSRELGVDWSYKTIQNTETYKDWRKARVSIREAYGLEAIRSLQEEGYICSFTKPGRSDQRKDPDYDPKHEEMVRVFMRGFGNSKANYRQRVASNG